MSGEVMGVVLAGGAGERLGGAKATVELAGRPLIDYPLAAFADAGIEAVVAAKSDTVLPALDARVIAESPEPRHPLMGVIAALESLARPIVVCPVDTPFVTGELLARLAAADGHAVVDDGGRANPLLARYEAGALAALKRGVAAGAAARDISAALHPARTAATTRETFNVNTPADLQLAATMVTRAL